jgi:very-short-patch-repair endonuclease
LQRKRARAEVKKRSFMNTSFIYNHPKYKSRRKDLRKNETKAEEILWKFLKNKQLESRKFRRQYSLGDYILDFYCSQERLAIEIDGEIHLQKQEYDKERTQFIENFNIKVLRFKNEEVESDLEKVLETIKLNFKK